jgi:hypothetical protein
LVYVENFYRINQAIVANLSDLILSNQKNFNVDKYIFTVQVEKYYKAVLGRLILTRIIAEQPYNESVLQCI